jgi:hypothetical protein
LNNAPARIITIPVPNLSLSPEAMKERFRLFHYTLDVLPPNQSTIPRRPAPGIRVPGKPSPTVAGTPMAMPPALFRAASNAQPDCARQREMHDELDAFFETICRAIKHGFSFWRTQARISGVRIMGASAIGGKIEGPPLDELMRSSPGFLQLQGWSAALRDGVAGGFAETWRIFSQTSSVPGLPWYPAFVAWPGPAAPPTPNVPTPMAALQQDIRLIQPARIKSVMLQKATPGTPYADAVFTSVSEPLSASLALWRMSQMVTLVMGKGPVPSFAPPYVPVGPVVGGDNLAIPGHLMA